MREYLVDPQRVYIGGLSAGAAAAAIMGATYPDLYAAIGVHSGLACGAANDLPSAFVAMRQGDLAVGDISAVLSDGPVVPTIVFHGDRDTTVHPRNGDRVIALSMRTTNTRKMVHRGRVPGGHAYTRTIHADASGQAIFEHWEIHGAGHAWSGGSPAGSYTDPRGRTPRRRWCASSSSTRTAAQREQVQRLRRPPPRARRWSRFAQATFASRDAKSGSAKMTSPPRSLLLLCSAHPGEALAQFLFEKSRLLEGGEVVALSLARFCVVLSEGDFSSVGHLYPLRVSRGLGVVVVVPIPPLVRWDLG
jgi:Esterase PHB depolymerase